MKVELKDLGLDIAGEPRLRDVNLVLEPGPPTVLLGPEGAGKTLLIRILAGLVAPSRGAMLIDGAAVGARPARAGNVAMVCRDGANYPAFTIYDNIAASLRRAGIAPSEIDRRVREAATLFGVDQALGRRPGALDREQQQRTALARALVRNPELIVLDQPFADLGHRARLRLRSDLRAILAKREAVVVQTTTEPDDALAAGGKVAVLDAGSVLQHDAADAVFRRPASLRVAEISSDPPMNVIDARVEERLVRIGETLALPLIGHLAGLEAGPYRFGVRARHLSMARHSAEDLEIDGTVELARVRGSDTVIRLRQGEQLWLAAERGIHSIRPGERIAIYLDPRHLFAFGADGALAAAPGAGGDWSTGGDDGED